MTTNETNKTIAIALKTCGFSDDNKSIESMKDWALEYLIEKSEDIDNLQLQDWYQLINIISPKTILPYAFYFHKNLCPITIYLIWERLKGKGLSISTRIFHELAFQAKEKEHDIKFNSLTHSVNSVIKIFESGTWNTPHGFVDACEEYKKRIEKE